MLWYLAAVNQSSAVSDVHQSYDCYYSYQTSRFIPICCYHSRSSKKNVKVQQLDTLQHPFQVGFNWDHWFWLCGPKFKKVPAPVRISPEIFVRGRRSSRLAAQQHTSSLVTHFVLRVLHNVRLFCGRHKGSNSKTTAVNGAAEFGDII